MNATFVAGTVSDELSISSGSSHGMSRTPSPSYTSTFTTTTSAVQEIYSRKVFVGGLPPDIDQGIAAILVLSC